ncbi:MAG: excinuclease ABC subunit UvrA, partial [Candidatus Binatia bacterium]
AAEHNLKRIDLTIPRNKFIVITGVSGSGKSSLAFDTLYAEGQRRYVESLSAYARQFLEQMERPEVDEIEGLSPAIAIEQKGLGKNPRSTVGTVTEIHDHLRVLFARAGEPHCFECGSPIATQTVPQVVDRLMVLGEGTRITILAPVVRGRKGEAKKEIEDLRCAGFVRARIDGAMRDLADEIVLARGEKHTIEAVVDRLTLRAGIEQRLSDSLEVAFRAGDEVVRIEVAGAAARELVFSQRFACAVCGASFPEISPRFFSFNSPYGACPTCSGLGELGFFDPELVIRDERLTLRQGAIAPWGKKLSTYHADLLAALGRALGFDLDTPFKDLPAKTREAILHGTGEHEIEFVHEKGGKRFAFRRPFEGVIGLLQKRYEEAPVEAAREEYGAYRSSKPCPTCHGTRLRRETESVTIGALSLSALSRLSIEDAARFFAKLEFEGDRREIARRLVDEIRARLGFLLEVGLEYLTLDRSAASLSGGEGQRLRLATQIGSSLVGVLYVLDEPSVGLHPRDNHRLLQVLAKLRDLGNTVVVVEHDRDTILAADWIVDMGPGAGEHGGEVLFTGPVPEIATEPRSVT